MSGYSLGTVAIVLAVFLGGGSLVSVLCKLFAGAAMTARDIDRDPTV